MDNDSELEKAVLPFEDQTMRVILQDIEADDWTLIILEYEEKCLDIQGVPPLALWPLMVEAHVVGEAWPIAFAVTPQNGQVVVTPLEADGAEWVVVDEESFSGHTLCDVVIAALLVGLRHPGVAKHADECGTVTIRAGKGTFLEGVRH